MLKNLAEEESVTQRLQNKRKILEKIWYLWRFKWRKARPGKPNFELQN
jgi:hypothetical protein